MLYCNKIVKCSIKKRPKNVRAIRLKRKKKLLAKFPLTYKRDPEDKRDYKFKTIIMESPNLQLGAKVDHTLNMSPVKDQGQLGSCVGFAVTAMKEWQERVENEAELSEGKRGKSKVYDLSEAWLYWNCKKIDAWPNEEGTSIRYAMQVLNKIGVPTEKAWPYDDVNIGEPAKWATLVARWNTIESYWRISNLQELKVALKDGPVPIGVACFLEIFYTGGDGIVPYPADPNTIYGGHAICAVGYDDTKQLVKFKNSWGTGWGENGYGYLPYSYIEDFMWDAWAARDHSVTRDMLKGTKSLI